jgi:hypothetical protein
MNHPLSTSLQRAAVPGRPQQGLIVSAGRPPYSTSGVQS